MLLWTLFSVSKIAADHLTRLSDEFGKIFFFTYVVQIMCVPKKRFRTEALEIHVYTST